MHGVEIGRVTWAHGAQYGISVDGLGSYTSCEYRRMLGL